MSQVGNPCLRKINDFIPLQANPAAHILILITKKETLVKSSRIGKYLAAENHAGAHDMSGLMRLVMIATALAEEGYEIMPAGQVFA
jgi:hypothetical protein